MYLLYSYFYICILVRRALHSFPTRRSSDLAPALATGKLTLLTNAMAREVLMDASGRATGVAYVDKATGADRRVRAKVVRSEEHTSELQSHSDIVFRLLLEKKK